VNAWLDAMRPEERPFEYRLLNARPQRWRPEFSAYVLARMGLTLAYSDGELRRREIVALVGDSAADALFPRDEAIQQPIEPAGGLRIEWRRIPPPRPPGVTPTAEAEQAGGGAGGENGNEISETAGPNDALVGSNNWAVSPRRTASGHALLAGDPHLTLSLPSIWYEAHLAVRDSLDVYGVTIAGTPFVVIGFNRNIAWSMTNTGADVADYYRETVDDDRRPTRYRVDGAWRPLERRIEVVRGRRGETLSTDTIYHTHRGPMLRSGGAWVSRRWLVVEPHDLLTPFRDANRARSVREFLRAMDAFPVPAQNMVAADREGHIAIRSTGRFPIRPPSAPRGDLLVDGASSANDWRGYWRVRDYPQAYDPAQGFVASANQQPLDPRRDPRSLGWDWPPPWRAIRINELLLEDSAVTPEAMRRMQTDPVSAETRFFLPYFLEAAEARKAADPRLARASAILAAWSGRFTRDDEHAALFEAALDELARRTWDELVSRDSARGGRSRRVATPSSSVLAELLQDADNPWWDDRSTRDVRERRDDILRASLAAAYGRLVTRFGEFGPAWRWEKVRHANINHLLRIPPLSRLGIPMQGGPGTISPSFGDGTHGASWRMVVELGPEVRGWGIYPGGQSGNPVSQRYDEFLPRWTAGELDTLRFPRRPDEVAGRLLSSLLTLVPPP
jgi:penicillin amidase